MRPVCQEVGHLLPLLHLLLLLPQSLLPDSSLDHLLCLVLSVELDLRFLWNMLE